jgi:hypothetical protein
MSHGSTLVDVLSSPEGQSQIGSIDLCWTAFRVIEVDKLLLWHSAGD